MKVLLFSNAVWSPTGYGSQSKQLVERLKADGHTVAMAVNWGLTGAPLTLNDVTFFPQGNHAYSLDTGNLWAATFFGDDHGVVISLYDVWPLLEAPDLFRSDQYDAWFWTPIDHMPAPPKVMEWVRTHDTIAMSEFGRDQMTAAGAAPGYTIPHGIETSVFKPTESDIRKLMDVPEDAHLTLAANANIGQSPVRKAWFENLLAWKVFAERHDDAYLYIHTQLRHPRGVDLGSFIQMWGLPADRVRIVDQGAYQGGMIGQENLAALFTAGNVTLAATAGEGFGLTPLESIACGTPAIGTDFSAQIEVIGDAGWLVPFHAIWDYHQGAAQASPEIGAIVDALEQSYTNDEAQRAACLPHAAKYDADKVYAEQWRPFLADREPAKPNRQQRRAQKRGKAA